jgi:hypothetical protein
VRATLLERCHEQDQAAQLGFGLGDPAPSGLLFDLRQR